ncbi:MAG: YibE/F family protein [Marinilabiliaceae bacterium]|nr:YibE/F family protein [Marinilabiliaceae bacterium]
MSVLIYLPTGFEQNNDQFSSRVKGRITAVDNKEVMQMEILKTGEQRLRVKILEGDFKGDIVTATNHLMGRMEFDKIFKAGDKVLVVLNKDETLKEIINASVVDHYRINTELILLGLFILLLIAFGGWTGVKALFSFVFTGLVIWKILIPGFLKGYNPILISLIAVIFLTAVIIFLVGGFSKKGCVAFLGAISGVVITGILSITFGNAFYIHGAVKPFSETLLYSGFAHLKLTDIFYAGIFLSSSGAVMDIAMDISASQHELHKNNPEMKTRSIIKSGFAVGKSVVGTMTTTLLLAYSGGFTALLMVFMAQGTPFINIVNMNYVSAEFLHTMVGSFGLVLVAPFTAIIGGWIYGGK